MTQIEEKIQKFADPAKNGAGENGKILQNSGKIAVKIQFKFRSSIFTQILYVHSNPRLSLMISIINSWHLCPKPWKPLRVSGRPNLGFGPLFSQNRCF